MQNTVTIVDVGPRDGFQNVKEFIPTDVKIEVIRALIAAGIREIEITSFISPKAIPQMADSKSVAQAIVPECGGIAPIALTPNRRGAEDAMNAGIKTVSYVISVSKSHNMANVRREPAESLRDMAELIAAYPELEVRLALGTSFGCPFEGEIKEKDVLSMVEQALRAGVKEVILCDAIGVANPRQVTRLLESAMPIMGGKRLGLHMHDTRGLGLANCYAGLLCGIDLFESSVGGLGGCPFAPGASGNTATEDLVNMMHSVGVETGIDLDKLLLAAEIVKQKINPLAPSHMLSVAAASACKQTIRE
jgi:hydroxymethylglutaryl-CoA lyase